MLKPYTGINRRLRKDRRQHKDRRLDVRFELSNEPRRIINDRRNGGAWEMTFSHR